MTENFIYNVKVYYEDTDAGGIVYYANFLKFIERARTEMIYQKLGMSHLKINKDYNAFFVVRSCNIKFLKSAKFEDNLSIHTKVLKKTPVRIKLLQDIKRDGDILVSSEVELAIIKSDGSVQKLPEKLISKI